MLKGVPTKPWVKDYRKRAGSRLTEVISLAASLSTCPECPPQLHNSHSLMHSIGIHAELTPCTGIFSLFHFPEMQWLVETILSGQTFP